MLRLSWTKMNESDLLTRARYIFRAPENFETAHETSIDQADNIPQMIKMIQNRVRPQPIQTGVNWPLAATVQPVFIVGSA